MKGPAEEASAAYCVVGIASTCTGMPEAGAAFGSKDSSDVNVKIVAGSVRASQHRPEAPVAVLAATLQTIGWVPVFIGMGSVTGAAGSGVDQVIDQSPVELVDDAMPARVMRGSCASDRRRVDADPADASSASDCGIALPAGQMLA